MTAATQMNDPKKMAEQQRLLTSVLAAGRNVADYNLSGRVAVGESQIEKTAFARDGLEALVKQSKKQDADGPSPASNAKPEKGFGPVPRVAAGLAADVIGHSLASMCGGPIAGGAYLAWAAGRSAQGLIRSAGATPGPTGKPAPRPHVGAESGYTNSANTKGSDQIGRAPKGSSYHAFADEADQQRGAAPIQVQNAKPSPSRPGSAKKLNDDFDFSAITLSKKQAAAAEKLLPQVQQQEENITRLMTGQTRMRADTIHPDAWKKMSFAEQCDARENGTTLLETGRVSAKGIRQFTQRHLEPTPAQQMVLTQQAAAPAPAFG